MVLDKNSSKLINVNPYNDLIYVDNTDEDLRELLSFIEIENDIKFTNSSASKKNYTIAQRLRIPIVNKTDFQLSPFIPVLTEDIIKHSNLDVTHDVVYDKACHSKTSKVQMRTKINENPVRYNNKTINESDFIYDQPWSKCSKFCGGGIQTRQRKCKPNTKFCPEALLTLTRECNLFPCKNNRYKTITKQLKIQVVLKPVFTIPQQFIPCKLKEGDLYYKRPDIEIKGKLNPLVPVRVVMDLIRIQVFTSEKNKMIELLMSEIKEIDMPYDNGCFNIVDSNKKVYTFCELEYRENSLSKSWVRDIKNFLFCKNKNKKVKKINVYDIAEKDKVRFMNNTMTNHKISSGINDQINVWIRESNRILETIKKIKNKSNIDLKEKKTFLEKMLKRIDHLLMKGISTGQGQDYEKTVKDSYIKNLKNLGSIIKNINSKSKALKILNDFMKKLEPKPEPATKPAPKPEEKVVKKPIVKKPIRKKHKRKSRVFYANNKEQFLNVPSGPSYGNSEIPTITITEDQALINKSNLRVDNNDSISDNKSIIC